jgi:hypothetical protein
MKNLVAGVQRVTGTSKTGNPFDMCNVSILTAVENVNNPKVTILGHGYKTMEVRLDPACIGQFSAVQFPCVLDLEMEPRPFMGKLETTVVGVKAAK